MSFTLYKNKNKYINNFRFTQMNILFEIIHIWPDNNENMKDKITSIKFRELGHILHNYFHQ